MGDSAEIPKDVAKALDKALQGNKELQNTLKHNKDLMNQFVSATQTYKSILDDVQSLYKDSEKDLMKTIKLQQGLVDLDGKRLGTSAKLGKLAKDNENIARDISSVYGSEALVFDSLLLKQNMMNTGLQGEYAQLLTTYMLENSISDVADDRVKALVDELKGRQHIYEKASKQLELDEATALKLTEIKEETEEWKHSITKIWETGKAIGRDPKVFGAFMLTQMVDKVEQVHEGFEKLSTSGLTVGQRIDSMTKGFSLMSMIGLSDTQGVLAGMVESMGTMNSLTSDEVNHVGHLAKEMGVTGQEAFGLVEGFSKLPGETMATAAHAADYVKSLSEANGVAPGKITKDIAKNTELMALGGYKSAKAFTEAAMKAQKMGVDLSTTKNIMSGLLNFEDSINKQMEASVLLGKEINFDKARELALSGKSVEATAEVLKNIGGQAEFEKMNVLQKQALAAATGMSVEELSKAVDAQAEFNKYHGEDVAAWKSGLGYAMEYGGAVGGFLKENGLLLLSTIQFMLQFNVMTKLGNGLLAIKNGLLKVGGALIGKGWLWGKGGSKMPELPKADSITGAADKAKTIPKDAGKSTGGLTKSIEKINPAKLLAGAAALVLVAAAVFIFAKAAQEFTSVPWSSIGKAVVSMLALVGAVALIGAIMTSGVGAIAILAGAAAMIIMATSLFILGKAIQEIGKGFEILTPVLGTVTTLAANVAPLLGVAAAIMGIAAGLGLMAVSGMMALPAIGGLIALATVAPALVGLGAALGGMFGGGGGEKEDKMDELIAEIRSLKEIASKGGVINMDGKKVGDILRTSINSSGVR